MNNLLIALGLIILNAFFVAAEFAFIKVRIGQLNALVAKGKPFAKTAKWLFLRLEKALSACQLGITMASLALGWIGEPALVHFIEPVLHNMGFFSSELIHTIGFIIAFSIITSIHLVIGEQLPKIYGLRRAEPVALWCALPLKFFYIVLYPFLIGLNSSTSFLLRRLGISDVSEHESVLTEAEIRIALDKAHLSGSVSQSEHKLLNAIFEFDDLICRKVMVPRNEITIIDAAEDIETALKKIRKTKHSRYPICQGSLDQVLGILHIKDLVGVTIESTEELLSIARSPKHIPEIMPISKLLKHFQSTRQLMALVVDEYGVVSGIVTLENVLEKIVGPVDDEFDNHLPKIIQQTPGTYLVDGATSISELENAFKLKFKPTQMDTVAGLIIETLGAVPEEGVSLSIQKLKFTIESLQEHRIEKVKITKTETT